MPYACLMREHGLLLSWVTSDILQYALKPEVRAVRPKTSGFVFFHFSLLCLLPAHTLVDHKLQNFHRRGFLAKELQ